MTTKYSHLEPEVIFFGGTFDPPHLGHSDCIDIVRSCFPLAKIVVLPSCTPPRSYNSVKTTVASFMDRLAMALVAFDDRQNVEVSSIEQELETPNFTVNTLIHYKTIYPSSRLFWLLGADQLESFTSWKDPKTILELAGLVVLPRPDMSGMNLVETATKTVSSLGLKHSTDRDQGVVLIDGAQPIFVINKIPRSVASQVVRQRLLNGQTDMLHDLSPAVGDYIKDIGLYQASEDTDE